MYKAFIETKKKLNFGNYNNYVNKNKHSFLFVLQETQFLYYLMKIYYLKVNQ
jgi:hypothetical protein